jgi:hypothetical protein
MNYKEFIIDHYPNGFSFEPMALRLLENLAGQGKWADEIIEELQEQVFERSDGVYLFPEQIADEETRRNIINTAEDWIKRFGCFSLNALWEKYSSHIKNLTEYIDDFENFLDLLLPYTLIGANASKSKVRIMRSRGTNRQLMEQQLAQHIQNILEEKYGTATEHDIVNNIPALDADLLAVLVKNHLPNIFKTDINEITCYQQQEAIGLPENLDEKINKIIIQLETVDLLVSDEAIHILLSLEYQTNFFETYQIPDWQTFYKVIEQHHQSNVREWKNGIFQLKNLDGE